METSSAIKTQNRALASVLLLLTTFFWGITFTIVKDAVALVDVFVFLAQRFILAFALIIPIALLRGGRPNLNQLRDGLVLGVLLFASYAFQTMALRFTTASNTGFLTGLSVVFVPMISALALGQRFAPQLLIGVGSAVAGLFLLCTNGAWSFNSGDLLAATCAVCIAIHLILTGRYSRHPDNNIYWLTTIQLGAVALLSAATAAVGGHPLQNVHPDTVWATIICALFATIFAFLVQTSMQRYISPAKTALIFCTEPVFAAIYAWIAAGERLGPIALSGALLILAGMLIAEGILPWRRAGMVSDD